MPINELFPVPQADNLDKLAVVTDAIYANVNTATAVAKALNVVDRQGNYYVSAAAYLGLIKPKADTSPVEYFLTLEGEIYQKAPISERIEILNTLLNEVPGVKIYLTEGAVAVETYYEALGLDTETSTRRTQTIVSWATSLNAEFLNVENLKLEVESVIRLAPQLSQELNALKNKQREPVLSICKTCFMALPATGLCDTCS